MKRILFNFLFALLLVCSLNYVAHPDRVSLHALILPQPGVGYLSPIALVSSPDGRTLYLAFATGNQVAFYNVDQREIVRRVEMPASPSGLAISPDGQRLYVTCTAPKSKICVVATDSGKVLKTFASGHTAMAPVLDSNKRTLYVCDRFNDAVGVVDLEKGEEVKHIAVEREPVAAALSPDGKFLFVANHIHSGPSDTGVVSSSVSVIDTAEGKLVKRIPLTNGSTLLRGICFSPDGRYVAVTHILARFHLPTTTVEHGWMNDNGLSLIDASRQELLTTVLLDEDRRGAGNPWGIAWSQDGNMICVTHAGTHEVSLIDAGRLLAKIAALPERAENPPKNGQYLSSAQVVNDVPNDLGFLDGLRTRVRLHGQGPRCLALIAKKVFVANYFSDSLSVLELALDGHATATIQLAIPLEISKIRRGEMYFNDATLCYQGWQSCASCHSSDARIDGMNWDLLNDGLGNPKNVKSLLLSFQTPPVMSMGVRADAGTAIRAGLRHILFTEPQESVASAIDEYVKNLQPIPSPYLFHNQFSPAAERGQKLFFSEDVGCAHCHPMPVFTDLKPHQLGTGKFDQQTDTFYTPTLIELWRTGPYMHDGSAATLRDAILAHRSDAKGALHLEPDKMSDLISFLISL